MVSVGCVRWCCSPEVSEPHRGGGSIRAGGEPSGEARPAEVVRPAKAGEVWLPPRASQTDGAGAGVGVGVGAGAGV